MKITFYFIQLGHYTIFFRPGPIDQIHWVSSNRMHQVPVDCIHLVWDIIKEKKQKLK